MVEKTDYKTQSNSSDSFTRSNSNVHEVPRHWEEEIPLNKIKFMQKDRIRQETGNYTKYPTFITLRESI